MDPNQARSIRTKKRLQGQLNFDDNELDDDDDFYTEKGIKQLDKDYKDNGNEEDELEKEQYFGYKIEAFNLKKDRELGTFHEDGSYEFKRKQDPDEIKDAWLDSLDDDQIIKKPKPKQPVKNEEDDKPLKLDEKELFHLKKELYDILLPGESANMALIRLKPNKPAIVTKKKNVRKKVKNEENSEQANALDDKPKKEEKEKKDDKNELPEEEKKRLFNRIIEICDILVSTGYMDVGTDTKEQIKEKFIKEEDKVIRTDLDELEKDLEDLNPDHNVVEE